MTVELFLTLLSGFSVLTGLIVESIKSVIDDKFIVSYNLIAVIIALIVGIGGTFIYYTIAGVEVTVVNVIYSILMGGASALSSMCGYDKIKQLVDQLKM